MSLAYLPQTDGQTKVLNRCLETYLCCFASSRQKQWSRWLLWAKYWYNTSYQTAMHITPFEIVYDRSPPTVHCYECGSTSVAQLEDNLHEWDSFLKLLRENLIATQAPMKLNADHQRQEQ